MSSSVSHVSKPYSMPVVTEPGRSRDRRRRREDGRRRGEPHAPADAPPSEETSVPESPEATPRIGTLINVRA